MSEEFNTDLVKSVAGAVIRDVRVLLVRHTYGAGKGRLIFRPGMLKRRNFA